jgi:hypothetical protein
MEREREKGKASGKAIRVSQNRRGRLIVGAWYNCAWLSSGGIEENLGPDRSTVDKWANGGGGAAKWEMGASIPWLPPVPVSKASPGTDTHVFAALPSPPLGILSPLSPLSPPPPQPSPSIAKKREFRAASQGGEPRRRSVDSRDTFRAHRRPGQRAPCRSRRRIAPRRGGCRRDGAEVRGGDLILRRPRASRCISRPRGSDSSGIWARLIYQP